MPHWLKTPPLTLPYPRKDEGAVGVAHEGRAGDVEGGEGGVQALSLKGGREGSRVACDRNEGKRENKRGMPNKG